MDSQRDFLRLMTGLLEQAGIPYMIAGSVSSSFYGKPRSTQDVDIVIDPDSENFDRFIHLLGPQFYVSQPAALDALQARGMFNIIDTVSGWKVDMILRKARPFSQEEFTRRRPAELMGVTTWVLSPEDSILSKLEWTRGRESITQLQDAIHVLITQWDTLDFDYLHRWAQELDIAKELDALIEQARNHRG
jgi:hypothetical protein